MYLSLALEEAPTNPALKDILGLKQKMGAATIEKHKINILTQILTLKVCSQCKLKISYLVPSFNLFHTLLNAINAIKEHTCTEYKDATKPTITPLFFHQNIAQVHKGSRICPLEE